MLYNIDFNIAAAILMIVTIGSYVSRKHLHDMQSRVFAVTLIGTLLALLLDTSTVVAENYWGASPQVLWWLNICSLVVFHLLPVLVTTYMHIVVGQIKSIARGRWAMLLLPCVVTSSLIISSRWTGLVMYIDENGKYTHGPMHAIIYITAMLYIVILAVLCLKNRRAIGTRKLFSSLLFILLLVMASIMQYLFPSYLIGLPAAALALLIMYLSLQQPGEFVDEMTSAYNHAAMMKQCERLFKKREHFFIAAFELDNFKKVNSYFGVKKGDALLCEVARYLYHDYKMCEVFRLEGDWFAVIIKGKLLHNMTMRDLSEKICSIPKVWKVGDNEIPLTASKVCLDSNDFDDFREMIALLTYASALEKQSGQDGFMIVNGDIKAQYIRRRRVESVLERAIEEGTIDVAYQPICSVETGRIVSAEALARLHDDELGNIPPSEFISIAEHNGMISSIGDIVRRKVCAFIAEQKLWQLGIKHVAVNLSVVECMQSDLHRKIIDDAQKYGTPLHMMRFEITESTAVESISVLRHNMEELIGNGISFHLDDYGTGYSNLSMILSLPFSVIKLDRSILHSTGDMGSDYPMHLSALFSELGMEVVCEGIEDAQQAERLRRWKVDYGQGWYYGKPLSPDAFVSACKAFAVCDCCPPANPAMPLSQYV